MKSANPSKNELRALLGSDLPSRKRKAVSLEAARAESRAQERAQGEDRAAKIRALEAKLQAMQQGSSGGPGGFQLAIVDAPKSSKAAPSSSSKMS